MSDARDVIIGLISELDERLPKLPPARMAKAFEAQGE